MAAKGRGRPGRGICYIGYGPCPRWKKKLAREIERVPLLAKEHQHPGWTEQKEQQQQLQLRPVPGARSFFVIIISPGALNAANTHTHSLRRKQKRSQDTFQPQWPEERTNNALLDVQPPRSRREQEILRTMRPLSRCSLTRPAHEERERETKVKG
jgi:hypothetical protein